MKRLVLLSALTLALGGCVTTGKYKSAVEETKALQAKISAQEAEMDALRSTHAAKTKEADAKAD